MLKSHERFHSVNGRRQILIADDELINRELLGAVFEDAFEGRPSRPFGHVMAAALRLSHIEDPKLYYKLVEMAEQQKVVRSVKQPETGDAYLEFSVNELPF